MKKNLIKRFALISQVLLLPQLALAQEEDFSDICKNTIQLELGGSAGYLYNLTYDRTIPLHAHHKISVGVGFQFYPSFNRYVEPVYSVSPQISYLLGKKHHLELGVGIAYELLDQNYVVPFRIGYRYQRENGGLFFRTAFTPVLFPEGYLFSDEPQIIPWGGVGIGITF